ncbi:MAG TPA: DoxX family protein [Dongiaceae bacterium]|nr:DoxX family protein [Dongiaceae bacterium]
MENFHNPNLGSLLLRVALGSVLLAHSLYLKLIVFTLAGTAAFFSSIGLPGWLAYVVFAVEAVTGITILLGIYTRLSALVVTPILLGATWAHIDNGWLFTNANGGWEYPLFLAFMSLSLVFVGEGEYALKPESSNKSAFNAFPESARTSHS